MKLNLVLPDDQEVPCVSVRLERCESNTENNTGIGLFIKHGDTSWEICRLLTDGSLKLWGNQPAYLIDCENKNSRTIQLRNAVGIYLTTTPVIGSAAIAEFIQGKGKILS